MNDVSSKKQEGRGDRRQKIAATVLEVIEHASGIDESRIRRDDDLLEDLLMDSLAIFEVAVDLEAAYGLEIPDDAIENLRTPGEIIDYIDRRAGKDGA